MHAHRPALHRHVFRLSQPPGDRPQHARRERLRQPDVRVSSRTNTPSSSSPTAWNRSRARASCAAASTTACRSRRTMDTFTFRDLDYLQPVRHRGRRRAGLQRIGDLHHPRPGLQRGLSVEPGVPRQQDGPADRHTAPSSISTANTGCPTATWRAAGRRSIKPEPTWVRIWKARALEIGAVRPVAGRRRHWCMRCATGWSARSTRKDKRWVDAFQVRCSGSLSIGFVGFYLMAAAVDHPGADLVPLPAVRVEVGAVPLRSVHLPVLDLHHHHACSSGGAACSAAGCARTVRCPNCSTRSPASWA